MQIHLCPLSRYVLPIGSTPPRFKEALELHLARHGDKIAHLQKWLSQQGHLTTCATLSKWLSGRKLPRTAASLVTLSALEQRYQLPPGYFRTKLPNGNRATSCFKKLKGIPPAERRRITWHLPDDFDSLPELKRVEILEWVKTVVIAGGTRFRRFQSQAAKDRYAISFPRLVDGRKVSSLNSKRDDEKIATGKVDSDLGAGTRSAPPELAREVAALIRFKTSTLTDIGFKRKGVWNDSTAVQRIEHLGLLFGALNASPSHKVSGYGVPRNDLAMGLLVFPAVWDWYVQWRERRRGFYTKWEADMVQFGLALTRAETGWLRQHPSLVKRLRPIPGLVSQMEIDAAMSDWEGKCDSFGAYGLQRAKEIQRVARVHRDPFEPILPVLESDSPVGEYRLITEEILRHMPDESRYPRAAAEAVRSFLLLRLGLHLGLRQKNLRELMFCPLDGTPRTAQQLENEKRGELRWSAKDDGWEVIVPASAFKNYNSSFFCNKPFQLKLPALGELYPKIKSYLDRHREVVPENWTGC